MAGTSRQSSALVETFSNSNSSRPPIDESNEQLEHEPRPSSEWICSSPEKWQAGSGRRTDNGHRSDSHEGWCQCHRRSLERMLPSDLQVAVREPGRLQVDQGARLSSSLSIVVAATAAADHDDEILTRRDRPLTSAGRPAHQISDKSLDFTSSTRPEPSSTSGHQGSRSDDDGTDRWIGVGGSPAEIISIISIR